MNLTSSCTNRPWPNDNNACCIVLAAGRGSRAYPLSQACSKAMIPVFKRPLIDYTIHYWKTVVTRFIFIVNHQKESLIDHVALQGMASAFIVQRELKGIADALRYCRDFAGKHFIVTLGDCLCQGKFHFPLNLEMGIGVQTVQNRKLISGSYGVELVKNKVVHVEEKPAQPINHLLGMGYYFLTDRVFDYIDRTPPSPLRGEIEITDVIENMIQHGENLKAVKFTGVYLNLNRPDDLRALENERRNFPAAFDFQPREL